MRRYNLTTYHGALPPEAVEFYTSKILRHVWEGAVPEGQGKGGLFYWIIFEGLGRLLVLSPGRLWLRREAGSSCPVDVWWLLHVLWLAAEDVYMAPALLELLLSHAGLPPPEPVAEHPCPEPDV